ncbi:hypothetical protein [Pasteuria penetrans]|uniref:hypothetical protein n=1 Tax=Pasteuria penetrans TaxID=86005 RepID=UPI000F925DAD|nr:hypothetical protein [Pasteuria penetrans]
MVQPMLETGTTLVLIIVTILSIMGTLYNIRTGNRAGAFLGGMLTLGIMGVTGLATFTWLFPDVPLPFTQ